MSSKTLPSQVKSVMVFNLSNISNPQLEISREIKKGEIYDHYETLENLQKENLYLIICFDDAGNILSSHKISYLRQ